MISVCVATYNGEKYIKEQLISILRQIGNKDEVIISDDGSTDGTKTIINNIHDERIKYVRNPAQRGYSSNFSNAINLAGGDIIFISDQDDVWMDGKVEIMVNRLNNCHMVISDAQIVDANLKVIKDSHFSEMGVKKGFLINLLKTRYIGACMAFRKEILTKVLPFPRNYKYCAYDYWLAIVSEYYYKVELVKEPLIQYRRHDNNALTGGVYSTNSLPKKLITRIYVLFELIRRIRK